MNNSNRKLSKYLFIALASCLLTACASSPQPLPVALCQPIPAALRVIPRQQLPVPANNSMGALVTAYVDAAEVYHGYRRDAIALDAAITAREVCDGGS